MHRKEDAKVPISLSILPLSQMDIAYYPDRKKMFNYGLILSVSQLAGSQIYLLHHRIARMARAFTSDIANAVTGSSGSRPTPETCVDLWQTGAAEHLQQQLGDVRPGQRSVDQARHSASQPGNHSGATRPRPSSTSASGSGIASGCRRIQCERRSEVTSSAATPADPDSEKGHRRPRLRRHPACPSAHGSSH